MKAFRLLLKATGNFYSCFQQEGEGSEFIENDGSRKIDSNEARKEGRKL